MTAMAPVPPARTLALLPPGACRLDVARCYELLGGCSAGHLALSQGALPVVVPVTSVIQGEHLLVRAGTGHLVHANFKPGIVAFQTGATSPDQAWRWEVLVRGPAEALANEPPPEVTPPSLPLLEVAGTIVLRIGVQLVTGWQYGVGPAAPGTQIFFPATKESSK